MRKISIPFLLLHNVLAMEEDNEKANGSNKYPLFFSTLSSAFCSNWKEVDIQISLTMFEL